MTQFSVLPSSNESEKSSKHHVEEHDEVSRKAFKNSLDQTKTKLNKDTDNQFHNQVIQLVNNAIPSITGQETADMSFTEDNSMVPDQKDIGSPNRRDLMHRQQKSGSSTVQSREDAKRGPQQ